MITKNDIIDKALEIGFEDAGFTGIEPFHSQSEYLENPDANYGWTLNAGLELKRGVDPRYAMDAGKSIIVLVYSYLRSSIPAPLLSNFGRCYLFDDRVTKDSLMLMINEFRDYLKINGINSKFSKNVPDKIASARAGVGTFGKNALLYASRSVSGSSLIFPIVLVVDAEFEPDAPSVSFGCPDWCRNACIAACPTRALLGKGRMNSQRCISYLTYHGDEITPYDLREPMGMYIYGCDRCQNVCPRNIPRLSVKMPEDGRISEMVEIFSPERILAMDAEYFTEKIWPRMFYMPVDYIWKWKMNAARAMGNSLDRKYITDLKRALTEEPDERVRGMAAWSLGHIGGDDSVSALTAAAADRSELVRNEVSLALKKTGSL